MFLDELAHALERHARSDLHLGVLYVDIDAFAAVNETLGHEAGDRLLGEAAERMRGAVRAGDIVARLGGDEFAILLELLEDDHEAVAVARRVIAAFERAVRARRPGRSRCARASGSRPRTTRRRAPTA